MHSPGRGTQRQRCWDCQLMQSPSHSCCSICANRENVDPGAVLAPLACNCRQVPAHANSVLSGAAQAALHGEQSMTSPQRCQLCSPAQLCQKVHPRDSVMLEQLGPVVTCRGTGEKPAQLLKVILCSYSLKFDCIKNWNCGRYGTVPYCFIERALSCKEVQLDKPLQQWGPSWIGARAEVGRATPLLLRAEWGLGLHHPLQPKMLHGSFICSIFKSLGWKWGTPLKMKAEALLLRVCIFTAMHAILA